jgi:hypothetical protein
MRTQNKALFWWFSDLIRVHPNHCRASTEYILKLYLRADVTPAHASRAQRVRSALLPLAVVVVRGGRGGHRRRSCRHGRVSTRRGGGGGGGSSSSATWSVCCARLIADTRGSMKCQHRPHSLREHHTLTTHAYTRRTRRFATA